MKNHFLKKIEDVKQRKFPLVYKHVEETISTKNSVDSGFVYTSPKRDAKALCLNYHKPISKLV